MTKSFGKTTVVDGVSFSAEKGEFICVLGPSGCGKTTLLRLVAGFERTESGTIVQAGLDITRLRAEERDFGIVFQSYALFPNRSVSGNIAFGLEATAVDKATRSRRVQELLELVGLEEHGGKYQASCRAANNNALHSHEPWRSHPVYCFWTSPFPHSM